MKIYEHELEAHQTLIEAMYKLDVLKEKDYRLVVQVLVLACTQIRCSPCF